MSPPGRPKGEYRSAQHEGGTLTATGVAQARSVRRRAIAGRPTNVWRTIEMVAEAAA
jgi:hypothetical protein